MLRLIDVCKSFKYDKNKLEVLKNINIDFKKKELVFILGKSGSGKSTLLNIIGGILSVDSGKVLLDDVDLTKFKDDELCYYRNSMIGFVFQNYNLIEYMSVIDNIRLGQTINLNNNDIDDILLNLDIYDKRYVKVDKLSGGEKQRVAIARALVNDPDIILCDEPTGALDSENGMNIMKILKQISKNKLVIVVSHDKSLADKFADRIINIVDGKIKCNHQSDDMKFNMIRKKKISIISIIQLAIKNLGLKKLRTLFTSLAISIGFMCILFILCLSKGFKEDIKDLERDVVSLFPISIYNGSFELNNNSIVSSKDKIIAKDKGDYIHSNKIDSDYISYINRIDKIDYIDYDYNISMPVISDSYKLMNNIYMKTIPNDKIINNNYEMLYGRKTNSTYEILLKIDSNNNVDKELLELFNIYDNSIQYKELIGRKLRVVLNDVYYIKNDDYYVINSDNEAMYRESYIELEIVGIVREKEIIDDDSYFLYNSELIDFVISLNSKSRIVHDVLNNSSDILGLNMNSNDLLSYLGYNSIPSGMNIYVDSLKNKEYVLNKLDLYNKDNRKLIYVDSMSDTINILKSMINMITTILLCFSFVSIVVSSLMIFILTGNRVLERTKEINILKSLGARRNDITKLFNIENLMIGFLSSLFGVLIIMILTKPINIIISHFLEQGIFKIYLPYVIVLSIINVLIVVLSGYIPAMRASKKKYS